MTDLKISILAGLLRLLNRYYPGLNACINVSIFDSDPQLVLPCNVSELRDIESWARYIGDYLEMENHGND
jgi:hypothetical protein